MNEQRKVKLAPNREATALLDLSFRAPASSISRIKPTTTSQIRSRTMEQRQDNSSPQIRESAQASLESATAADSLPKQAANPKGHVEVSGKQSINTPAKNEAEGGAVVDGNLDGMAAEKDPEGAFSSW